MTLPAFDRDIALPPEPDVTSLLSEIRLGLEELRKLYASEGYINVVPVPNTYPNDEGSINRILTVNPCERARRPRLEAN